MQVKVFINLMIFILFLGPLNLNAQYQGKRSSVELRVVFLNESSRKEIRTFTGPNIKVDSDPFGWSIFYNYHYDNHWAFFIGTEIINAKVDVETSLVSQETETSLVVPIFFGAKYYYTDYESNFPLKLYVRGGLGIVLGFESGSSLTLIESHTESAAVVRIGVGFDMKLTSFLNAGLELGYLSMSNFGEAIAARKDYSGSVYSFGIGIMF